MFETLGVAVDETWLQAAGEHVRDRLGQDLAIFVVDADDRGLAACAAGTIARRLPTPPNPSGLVGYVQWVSTDPGERRRGHARAVMDALLNWYAGRDVRSVELHATPEGEPLYRSQGFSDSGGGKALRRRPWGQAVAGAGR